MNAKTSWLIVCILSVSSLYSKQEPFVLLTMLYNETDPQRVEEYKTCIKNNKSHDLIGDIHVLYDTNKDDETNLLLNFLYQENITVTLVSGRASYGDFFDVANQLYPEKRIILTNADIYFNETLHLLDAFDLTGTFLTITRWNLEADGSKELPTNYYTKQPNPGSHDTWIFQAPINVKGSHTISLGIMGCDGSIAYLAEQSGLTLLNPCYSIECLHLHRSPVRHYWTEKRYAGKLKEVACSTLPEKETISNLAKEG